MVAAEPRTRSRSAPNLFHRGPGTTAGHRRRLRPVAAGSSVGDRSRLPPSARRGRKFSVSAGPPVVSSAASRASARCRRALHHDQTSSPIDSTAAAPTSPAKNAHHDDQAYPVTAAKTAATVTATPRTTAVRRHVHPSRFCSGALSSLAVGATRATVAPGGRVENRTFGPPAANWITSPSKTGVGRSMRLPLTNVPLRL